MATDALIQIRDVSRRDTKTDRLLLNHVNLCIGEGERIGLVGPTGSGKSSLLRTIAKLDRADSGDVLFRNQTVSKDAIPTYRRKTIYLPQRPSFVAGTVRENLQLPFRLAAAVDGFDEQTAIDWLGEFARPQSMLGESVEKLSGGEQQIVALIRAIILSPQVLLLDEPTASLDAAATERLEKLVLAWHNEPEPTSERGRALVWTSHDLDQVRRMTTRIATIRGGVVSLENHRD